MSLYSKRFSNGEDKYEINMRKRKKINIYIEPVFPFFLWSESSRRLIKCVWCGHRLQGSLWGTGRELVV